MVEKDLPGTRKHPHLFAPRKIGNLTARNSVKYAACSVSNFNAPDGHITEREMGRMGTVAATGAGIITNQGAYPDREGMGKAYFRQISIADDEYIPGLARVADLIHEHGAIAIQQILHGGRYGGIDRDHCLQASDVPQTLRHFRPPRRMTRDQIAACIDDHVAAARRALQAGFEGVEVTSFMGYLLSNFLSPFTNDRDDEYGGSLENRGRFMRELVSRMKDEIGDGIFWIRLNGEELMDDRGGSTPEDCIEYMRMAEAAGADGISIVVGWHESRTGALGRDLPSDHWLYLAERAKVAVDVPVAFGPRFGDPVMADRAIAEGKIDFWEVCRPFLADPELLTKVAEDRMDEIRPCLGGLTCLSRMFRNLPYICTVNPRLGHEYDPVYRVEKAPARKKVMVIGGGPAGMECARAAAARGHEVVLYDRTDALGGQLHTAAFEIQGGGDVFKKLVASYERQLENAGVEVRLGTEVDRKLVEAESPDVAVVATGARIALGAGDRESGPRVVLGDWRDPEAIPDAEQVVVLGGERAGLVLAEHLASGGAEVTVVAEGKIGADVGPTFKWRHMSWVRELGIRTFPRARVAGLEAEGVRIVDQEGEEHRLGADLVVVAGPRESENELVTALEYSADELMTIGDAVAPRSISWAIHEGFRVGNAI